MLLLHPSLRRRPEPVTARFISLNISNTLYLKALGFMETQQAHIVDVTESSLKLRMGDNWLNRNPRDASSLPLLEIHLNFSDVTDEAATSRPHATSNLVDVTIVPVSRSWTVEEFESAAKRLVRLLRSHFMAC